MLDITRLQAEIILQLETHLATVDKDQQQHVIQVLQEVQDLQHVRRLRIEVTLLLQEVVHLQEVTLRLQEAHLRLEVQDLQTEAAVVDLLEVDNNK